MSNTNGWTQHEYKQYQDLLIKANWLNLVSAYNQMVQEIGKRNKCQNLALKPCGCNVKQICDCDYFLNDKNFEEREGV